MLENGFFHADPHAGNLLALPNGKLCYLDFGMVSDISIVVLSKVVANAVLVDFRETVGLTTLVIQEQTAKLLPAKINCGVLLAANHVCKHSGEATT